MNILKKLAFLLLNVFLIRRTPTLRPFAIAALVAFAAYYILLFIAKRGGDKIPELHCYLFSGSMGAGKSYLSTECAVSLYRRRNLHYTIYRLFGWLEKLPLKPCKTLFPEEWKYPCRVYSTYPICLKWQKIPRKGRKQRRKQIRQSLADLKVRFQNATDEGEKVVLKHEIAFQRMRLLREPLFCDVLLPEHLLTEQKLPENSVVVIGEAGRVLPQWDFDNPIVVEQIAFFVAFSRQFFNATILLDDQCSDNVVKAVRCRLGMIYHLHNFRRLWGIFPYYKVDYTELLPVEDTTLTTKEEEGATFFVGRLPYPWTPFSKRYSSRMYQELYYFPAEETCEKFDRFYTRYLINIAVEDALCKYYRSHKREYKRNYLYNAAMRYDMSSGRFVSVTHPSGGGATGEGVHPLPVSPPEDTEEL